MSLLNDFDKNDGKTVDYFIDSKVDDLIERAVIEGKRRQKIANKLADDCSDINTTDGIEYLNSIANFSEFPKYCGRGIQDTAPDLSGDSLTMWFSEVDPKDADNFIAQIVNAGFIKQGQDYVKTIDNRRLIMSVSTLGDKLRIYYKHD